MRLSRFLGAAVLPLVLLAGCGEDAATDDTSAEPAASASTSPATESDGASASPAVDLPPCRAVWKDGAKLPRGYAGCTAGGETVEPTERACSFGRKLVTYADHYYAVRSGTIHRTGTTLEQDRGYKRAMASCMA